MSTAIEKKEVRSFCDGNNSSYNHKMIHIYWVIFLLVVVIIGLVALLLYKVPNGQNLVDYVTNFSTILSIILSVSSISYAYYTSRDTSSQYQRMDNALIEIRSISEGMADRHSELIRDVHSIETETREVKTMVSVVFNRYTNSVDSNNELGSLKSQVRGNESDVPSTGK